MHIERQKVIIKYKKNMILLFCMCMGISSCGIDNTEAEPYEMTSVEIAKIFQEYDTYNNDIWRYRDAANAFDIREIQVQVENYWNYYEQYTESRERLNKVIKNWDTDFLSAGIYEVGKDIPAGYYVFCDAEDPEEKEKENTIEILNSWEEQEKYGWGRAPLSQYFYYYQFNDGQIVNIAGNPKIAKTDQFPEDKEPKDGVYYGTMYEVGTEIEPGEYFILSMDTEEGAIDFFLTSVKIGSDYGKHERNRFGYLRIKENDAYLQLKNSILFSLESKPAISPVSHENISYLNEDNKATGGKEHAADYHVPVYVQGEYKIGEDIPLGTYEIQNEIALPIANLTSEEYHSDTFNHSRLDVRYYSWSGIYIPYDDMAKQCGLKSIRLSLWHHDRGQQSNQYIETIDSESKNTYSWVTEGYLPTVTFTKEDAGCVVRIVRAILIPEQDDTKAEE